MSIIELEIRNDPSIPSVKLIECVKEDSKSPWGNCFVTITSDMLSSIAQGKVLMIKVMDEYMAYICVGDHVKYEED